MNNEGKVFSSAVSFYKSVNGGRDWFLVGKINRQKQNTSEFCLYDGSEGFSEPAFEVLKDGFICVMRTGSGNPMYLSLSKDKGHTWSTPYPFTPNGVFPQLQQLDNGVIALSSGRPGVQLRFCLDGIGKIWTCPIEMMQWLKPDGTYELEENTCGYTDILKAKDGHSFYMVYSDFSSFPVNGELRKAIVFRKVSIELVTNSLNDI